MKQISFLLVLTLLLSGISYVPARAGASDIIVDATSYSEELDNSVWNNPDGDLVVEGNTIVFDSTSSEYTRLITKTAVKATAEVNELVSAAATLQFTALPKDERFSMALGVKKIESMQGESGNVEISFGNDGGLVVSVLYYNEDGDETVLAAAKKCGSLGSKVEVVASVTKEQELAVKINGKQFFEVEIPVSGEGRIGFLQTGSCGVKLSDIKIVSHLYNSPENCDIYEDFEKDGFNANLLTSKMRGASYVCWPSGTSIKEQDGNHVFQYTNAGECYIGTQYTYSNFEMSFDVPYMQRQNELDEEGNIVTARSNQFGISYGGEANDFDYAGYTDAVSDVLWFTGNSTISSMKTGETVDLTTLGYPIYAKDCEKGFSVKVTMTDSVVKVFMKWLDEKDYKEVFKYQISTITPTGYLHIWTIGPTNMAIDNLQIKNTDVNPQLIDVDFKSSIIEGPQDYDYKPMVKDYALEKTEDGFNWFMILPIVAGVCVLVLGITVGITEVKRRRKAGEKHEI